MLRGCVQRDAVSEQRLPIGSRWGTQGEPEQSCCWEGRGGNSEHVSAQKVKAGEDDLLSPLTP